MFAYNNCVPSSVPNADCTPNVNITAAMLSACVELADPDDPRTARIAYRFAHRLRARLASQHKSSQHKSGGSVNRNQPPAPPDGVGSARTGGHHRMVTPAEQAAPGPAPNRPGRTLGRRGTTENNQPPS
jgi:hypothetical protein